MLVRRDGESRKRIGREVERVKERSLHALSARAACGPLTQGVSSTCPASFDSWAIIPCRPAAASPEQIVVHRKSRGLTQQESARLLGVDPSTLSKWERGERAPRGRYAAAVKDGLPRREE